MCILILVCMVNTIYYGLLYVITKIGHINKLYFTLIVLSCGVHIGMILKI